MFCPSCGHEVAEAQKFCEECGRALKGITDVTVALPVTPPAETPVAPAVEGLVEPSAEDPVTPAAEPPVTSPAETPVDPPVASPTETPVETPDEPAELPRLADLPTREIRPRDEIPDPAWSEAAAAAASTAPAVAPDGAAADVAPDGDAAPAASPAPELFDDLTTPTPAYPAPAIVADEGAPAEGTPAHESTTTMDAIDGPAGTTDELPELFDGSSDVYEYPVGRDPFKVKVVFIAAFFGAIAAFMSAAADVIDIRTSVPVDGITSGIRTIDSLGSNLAIGGFIGGVVMVVGGLLACFGFRWGAGLAGGAGLALAGWAGLAIGLAELRIASAESITRQTADVAFTLKVTRDLGFWLFVTVAVLGLLVFVASLRSFGTGGQPALNPWIAAIGAVAGVVLAAGPLIPEGNANFSNNYRSPSPTFDLPTAYFGGRLGQLALIAFAVVFGLLIVRAYGLGLAAGGVSVGLWMWISSLAEIGDNPWGIAAGNFGGDRTPHAVTTVGISLTLLMLIVAAILGIVSNQRSARY